MEPWTGQEEVERRRQVLMRRGGGETKNRRRSERVLEERRRSYQGPLAVAHSFATTAGRHGVMGGAWWKSGFVPPSLLYGADNERSHERRLSFTDELEVTDTVPDPGLRSNGGWT